MRATPFTYPVVLEPDDNGTVMATLPDFPGATFGEITYLKTRSPTPATS